MKFHKNITAGPVTLPTAAVKLCGLEAGGKAELHALEGAAVLMKASMNAMELIHALDSLHQLTVDLAVHLIKVCGPCDGCGGECPFGDFSYEEITLPDDLREEAGIPAGGSSVSRIRQRRGQYGDNESGSPAPPALQGHSPHKVQREI